MTEEPKPEIIEAPKEEAKAPTIYQTPEIIAEMDETRRLWNILKTLADTEWGAPFGGGPGKSQAQIAQAHPKMFAAALQGRALDVDTMSSLREISIIRGKPFLSAELRSGLARRAGHIINVEAYPDKAVASGRRKDTNEEMVVTYSLEEAVDEGLVDLDDQGKPRKRSAGGEPLPWERFTSSMLLAGATRRLVDRLFPDVMIGRSL